MVGSLGRMVGDRRGDAFWRGRITSIFATLSAAAAVAVVVMTVSSMQAPIAGGGRVELRQAVTQKLEQDGKCDSSCQQKADLVKAQMEALRKEIMGDYKSMTHFGDKAGYVPPPRSIKAQVMDGSLLSDNDGPAAPPPFSPNLSAASTSASAFRKKVGGGHRKAFGAANMKKLLRSQEPRTHAAHHSSTSHQDSSILPPVDTVGEMEKKMLRDTPATPANSNSDDTVSILHPDRDVAVHVHSSRHGSGKAKWAKEFDFMKHDRSRRAEHHAGEAKWAKEFSFVRHHAAKARAHARISSRAVRTKSDALPSVVKKAMEKALSFAPHESKTEVAGDKLLGLHRHDGAGATAHKDPLAGKFLAGWFGA